MPITFSREDIQSPERLELVLRQIAAALHTLTTALPALGPADLKKLASEIAPDVRDQLQATGRAPLNLQSLLPLPPDTGALAYVYETAALANHGLVLGTDVATKVKAGPLGTATTVLHGAVAGDPTYSAVSLTADVTGTLPVANGGTAAVTAAAARASLGAAATPVVLTTDVSGVLPVASGGTAAITAALARASLSAAAIQAPAGAPHAIPLAKITALVMDYARRSLVQEIHQGSGDA